MKENIYKVYIKIDENSSITEIQSGRILGNNTYGWTEIDEGEGDRFAHAQSNYLELPLLDKNGVYNYFFADGYVVLKSADEKAVDNEKTSILSRIAELKTELSSTDYMAIKYAEGWIRDADYKSTKELRQSIRDEINDLEEELI